MLQDIRENAQGTVAKIIVGLIVLTFALWGVDSIVGGFSGEPSVATVNGEDISQNIYERAVDAKKRQLLAQMGENADPSLIDDNRLRGSVLEGLIGQQILIQAANEAGIFVSDTMIDQLIVSIPQFQIDGEFNNDMFLATIRNIGMTTKSYRDALKKEVLISQARNGLIASAFVPKNEFNRLIDLDRQTRDFYSKTVDARDFTGSVKVDDSELKAYYETNKQEFTVPEQVTAAYIVLDKTKLAASVSVSEEDVVAAYEKQKDNYEVPEERKVSHILIETGDKRTDEEAKAIAEKVISELKQGVSFADAAKKYSDDVGSAENGGDLGFVGRGAFESSFEDAMFELTVGDVSAPVETDFGVHVLTVTEVQKGDTPTLDEMRASIEVQLKSEEAEKSFVNLHERLADITYSSPGLDEASEALGLEIKTQSNISREKGKGDLDHPKILQALFSDDVLGDGNNSNVIDLTSDRAVVVRVLSHEPEKELVFEEVSEGIRTIVTAEKALKQAKDETIRIAAEIVEKGGVSHVRDDTSWSLVKESGRNNEAYGAPVMQAVFALTQEDSVQWVKASDSTYMLIVLDNVNSVSESSLGDKETAMLKNILNTNSGASEYQAYEGQAKDAAEIERI